MDQSLFFSSAEPCASLSRKGWWALAFAAAVVGCAAPETANNEPSSTATTVTTSAPAPAPGAPLTLPYNEAVLAAARQLFGNAQLPDGQTYNVVIDPLVDGSTGMQSLATADIEKQVVSFVRRNMPKYQIKPLNAGNVAALPLVFIGTFTPINLQGKGEGERDAYRICFALADLKTGKIVSKGLVRALTPGVDPTPLPYFRDAPLWVSDPAVEGYIKTCQGTKAGEPINPAYLDKVVAVAAIDEANKSYNSRNYRESLALYMSLLRNPAGDQARVHTGVYLSNLRLGRGEAAMQAFGKVAQQGMNSNRLAVKFNFQTGGVSFAKDDIPYDLWINELGEKSAQFAKASESCFEIGGHTGRGGSEALNERISLQRAEYVKQRLVSEHSYLASRITAKGYGSTQALVATGREDQSDALDRRIEFKPTPCS